MMHEDVRRLIKCGSHHLISAPADMTVIIELVRNYSDAALGQNELQRRESV